MIESVGPVPVEVVVTLIATLLTAVNRVAELVKRELSRRYPDIVLPDGTIQIQMQQSSKELIVLGTSFLAGVFGSLAFNINVLDLLPDSSYLAGIPRIAGVIGTGALCSFGSEGAHAILDLIYDLGDRLRGPVIITESTEIKNVSSIEGGGNSKSTVQLASQNLPENSGNQG